MIKKTYEAPELEMLEVVVEQGFANSEYSPQAASFTLGDSGVTEDDWY